MPRIGLAVCVLAAVACNKRAAFGPVGKLSLAAVDGWCGSVQAPILLEDGTTMTRCSSQRHPPDYVDLRVTKTGDLAEFLLAATPDHLEPMLFDVLRPSLDDAEQRALDELVDYVRATDAVRPFPRIDVHDRPHKEWYSEASSLTVDAVNPARDVTFSVDVSGTAAREIPPAAQAAIERYVTQWCVAHGGHLETPASGVTCKGGDFGLTEAQVVMTSSGELASVSIDDLAGSELLQFADVALLPLLANIVSSVSRADLVALTQGSDDIEKNDQHDPRWPVGLDIQRTAPRHSVWMIHAASTSAR